jgi:hypothetical protein
MTGTKTAPRSSSTPAISSSAFSPVAYSKMDNIMKYNAIQQRINSLSTIYENLKETTYNMDSTILNMWKNWVDDHNNKFNTYLINYTLDGHNSIMNERLKRIDNLYNHIYQLEKERDLINIEEEESEEEEEEEEEEEIQKGMMTKSLNNEYVKWCSSAFITNERKELTKYLLPYFDLINSKKFLFAFMKDDYICKHTVEKLLREMKGIEEQKIKHPNICVRERHSLRQLDGFFDYSELYEIKCSDCANKNNTKVCKVSKNSQLQIYEYLERLYRFKQDVCEHTFINDIIETIKSGGYGEYSDEIVDCDYITVKNIINYLMVYYEEENTYSYVNLIPEFIIKAIQDLFLILVYRVIRV